MTDTLDQIADFCSVVFGGGATEGDVLVGCEDETICTRDPDEIAGRFAPDQDVWVELQTRQEDGTGWEHVGISAVLQSDQHPEKVLPPTLMLRRDRDGLRCAIWLLEDVLDVRGGTTCDKLDAVAQVLGDETCAMNEAVPLPGFGGWSVAERREAYYSAEALAAAFLTPPEPANGPVQVGDACWLYGDLDEALLEREIELSTSRAGRRTLPGKWRTWKPTIRNLLGVLSKHEPGEKDGNCFLQGHALGGDRKASAIHHLDLLVLDLDTGESLEAIRARLQHLGLFGVIYTTHSHLKPVSEFKKDVIVKWSGNQNPTKDEFCAWLMEVKRYRPEILEGAELLGTEHTPDGIMLRLRHKPMPKFRVVLFLKDRFVIGDRGGTQQDAIREWKERYAGASKLLGAYFDRSCVDPSRLFYTPRHPRDAKEFRIEVIAGKPLDIETVERVTAQDLKAGAASPFEEAAADLQKSGRYKTASLKWFFAKYGDRFEVDDFLLEVDPDGDRGARSNGPGRAHRCPQDDAHSDAGNEEDKGFFCVNATESETGTATAKCMHDSCSTLDRIDLVDLACQAAGIEDATELKKWVAEVEGDEEEEEGTEEEAPVAKVAEEKPKATERKRFGSSAEAKKAIEGLTSGDPEGAEEIAVRIGMTGFSAVQNEALLKSLAKKSGIGMKSLTSEVKRGERLKQVSGDDDESDGTLDDDALASLAKLNKEFAVVQIGGKVRILQEPKKAGKQPDFLEIDGWKTKLANKKVVQTSADGSAKLIPLARAWLEWPDRRTYDDVVFEPGANLPDCYNLWKGLAVTPKKGDWSILRGHIFDNICLGNEEYFEWLMTWFAQIFQHPGKKLGSAVVVQGKKGTGKSIVFDWVKAALGQHGTKVSQRDQITGKFNAHQMGKVLIICEEAFWAGDASAGGVLKDTITSKTMQLERKGVDAIEVSNYARYAFISNEDWVVPAGLDDERRYFVLRCGNGRQRDRTFFAGLNVQMEKGGLEAMVYEFMNWKPKDGDWDTLRNPPTTPWLIEQGIESTDVSDRFFMQVIQDGCYEDDAITDSFILKEDEENHIPIPTMRKCFETFLSKTANGRHKVGNWKVLEGKVERWLLSRPGYHPRSRGLGDSRPRVFVCPSLKEIREHAAERGLAFDLSDEEV